MTREQAKNTLMNLINQLKLTKAEYDVLAQAVSVLAPFDIMPPVPVKKVETDGK